MAARAAGRQTAGMTFTKNAHLMPAPDDDSKWRAVFAHHRRADTLFVYGGSSTRIYCRPSCARRRPRRDRVAFFDSPESAAREGYRACRRCRPDEKDAAADPWVDKVRRACVYLSNVEGRVSLARLAARLGGSPYHLQRSFKRIVGVTPREYADACRLNAVKRGLKKTAGSGVDVTNVMLDAGYASSSRFYEGAAAKLGMSPTTYKRGGAGTAIRFAIVDSPLGRLLVAATERGVCSVAMGDSDQTLESSLRHEFAAASISRDAGA